MKNKFLLLIATMMILVTLSSCASMMSSMELSSAKNRAEEHKYIEAIQSAVSSLAKSENKSTEAADLIVQIVGQGDAYYTSLIAQYRASDKGNALAEIYKNYVSLVNLYTVVTNNNLQNFTAGGVNYSIEVKDYSAELNSARDEAGKAYYDSAVRNMDAKTLAGYRQAYNNLDFVKSMYSNMQSPFSDLDSRIKKALDEGTIDIYVVVPSDLKMDQLPESMGSLLKSNVAKQSKWVKFHSGNDVDMAYKAWEIVVAGESFLDSASGNINNSNGVLEFGKEIGADMVIYAAFDQLKSDKIKIANHDEKFSGTSNEKEKYVMDLQWKKYSKETSVRYSMYVVDVKAGKPLVQAKNWVSKQDILLYAGTYTLTPNIWSTQSTTNFADILGINDIREYRYVSSGLSGLAYRVNYEAAELEARDKGHFDEQMASFERFATTEAQYITVGLATNAIVAAIENLL